MTMFRWALHQTTGINTVARWVWLGKHGMQIEHELDNTERSVAKYRQVRINREVEWLYRRMVYAWPAGWGPTYNHIASRLAGLDHGDTQTELDYRAQRYNPALA